MVDLWVWENFLAPISVTLGQGDEATKAEHNLHFPNDKVRTAYAITTKLSWYFPLITLFTWLNFGEILQNKMFV